METETSTWIGRFFSISYQNVEAIAGVVDAILIVSANIVTWMLCQYFWVGQGAEFEVNLGVGIANGLAFIYVASSHGLYRLPVLLAPSRYLARLIVTWAAVALFINAFLFLLKENTEITRGVAMTSVVLQIILLLMARWISEKIFRSMMATGSLGGSRVVTIGEPEELLRLSKSVLFRYFGLKEVARVSIAVNRQDSADEVLIDIDRAIQEAREHGAEKFIVAVRWSSKELLETIRDRLRASPLPARLLPDHTCRSVLGRRAMSTGGPNLMVDLQRAPLTPVERAIKRSMDIGISVSAIALLSPIFALTAIAIKLDSSGSVIFRQRRNGFNAKQFVIYKFRTMTVEEDGSTVTQARRGDHRVTRVGQFLRRSSIDELPQLFNVLKGDMSIVGPRPHALAHDNEYKALIGKYAFRHHVKPGITGWAQVNGLRGETQRVEQMAERVGFDLWYINHWSFGFDVSIILRTCVEVLRNRAY